VTPTAALFLFLALRDLFGSGKGGKRPKKDPFDFTPTKPVKPSPKPGPSPDGFEIVPASTAPSGSRSKWVPYAPLIPEVIERASQILNQRGAKEIIEPDPADKTRVVRYLRTTDSPPGHVQVTAWRARDNKPATVRS
jgi:hypothetical protein